MIDPPTMFLALVASTMAAVLLLLWCYWLNRCQRSLLWMAGSFFTASAATFLIGGRGQIPNWLSIDVGVAVLLFGTGLTLASMRVFNGRPVKPWMLLTGAVLWLIACRVPAFYDSPEARVIAGSTMVALYYLAAAREVVVRDGLVSRLAVSSIFVVHSLFVLMRIPLILTETTAAGASFAGRWFGPTALESAIFIQVVTFFLVSMIKERVENQLRSVALTDSLTGLGNRRAFFEASAVVLAQNARRGRSTATIIFDLDRFKEINDRFGHPVGDAVIQAFAKTARKRLRACDIVGRLGGEEFAVTLSETTGAQACFVAAQMNEAFAAAVVDMALPGLRGTASAGVAESPMTTDSLEDLLTSADRALYEAKALGGGRVCAGATQQSRIKEQERAA